jgi:hypothetical protein
VRVTRSNKPLATPGPTLAQATPTGSAIGATAIGALVRCLASLAFALAASAGCGENEPADAEGGSADAQATAFDLCDAFTGVGTACPAAGPLVCFPMCEAGGCFCSSTPAGPQWSCVTDRSCEQVCAPIDDACAADAGSE